MNIITWNCNGAFRKKFEYISDFNNHKKFKNEYKKSAEDVHSTIITYEN